MKIIVKIYFILLLLGSVYISGSAQNTLPETKHNDRLGTADSIAIYLDLASEMLNQDPHQTLYYAEKVLPLAQKINDVKSEGVAYKSMGSACFFSGMPDSARMFYTRASRCFEAIGYYQGISQCENNIGLVFRYQSQYDSALFYIKKALDFHKSRNNLRNQAGSLGNIATIYYQMGQLEEAAAYYTQALDIIVEMKDTSLLITNLCNLGVLYEDHEDHDHALQIYRKALNLAVIYQDYNNARMLLNNMHVVYHQLNKLDSAEYFLTEALLMKQEHHHDISKILWNLGILKAEKEEFEAAISYYFQALKINNENGNQRQVAKGYRHIGGLLMKKGEYNKALDYFEQAYDIAKEIDAREEMRLCAKELSITHSTNRNFEQAHYYFDEWIRLSDSVFMTPEQQETGHEQINRIISDKKAPLQGLLTVAINVILFGLLFALIIFIVHKIVLKKNKIKGKPDGISEDSEL